MNYVDELLPELQLAAPGATPTLIAQMLRVGVSRFLRDNDLWRLEIGPVYTFGGLDEYVIRPPHGGRIGRLLWARMDGRDLTPLEPEDMVQQTVDGYRITNDSPQKVVLGTQTQRGKLVIGCTAFPPVSSEELPEAVVDDFREELKASGLAMLYGTAGSPEYDMQLAVFYAQQAQQSALRSQRLTTNRRKGKRRTVKYGGY